MAKQLKPNGTIAKAKGKPTKKATKTEKQGAKFNEVQADYKVTGIKPADLLEHFSKLKVDCAQVKGTRFSFTYSARGATKADIEKRLRGLKSRKGRDGVEWEYIAPKPKADAK